MTYSIFSELPQHEKDFLSDSSARILRKAKDSSLESMLVEVKNIFKGKQYGWEEAIMDGYWYRYPSEIKKMRFCSEEALKDFLILKTLGVPAQYAVVENYDDRGLSHELNILDNGGYPFVMDWEIFRARIGETSFEKTDGKKVNFGKITYLRDHEVLERVKSLRSGNSFMEAIESGQILYTKHFKEGEFEAFVQYHPEKKELDFLYTLTKIPGGLRFYFLDRLILDSDKLLHEADYGVIPSNNVRDDRIPIILFKTGLPDFKGIKEATITLDDEKIWMLGAISLYGVYVVESKKENWPFAYSQYRHRTIFKKIKSEDCEHDVINNYDMLKREVSLQAARRYFDFSLFNGALRKTHTDTSGLIEYFKTLYAGDPHVTMGLVFNLTHIQDLENVLSLDEVCKPQQRLWTTFCEKNGIPEIEYSPSEVLKNLMTISPVFAAIFQGRKLKIKKDKENNTVTIFY